MKFEHPAVILSAVLCVVVTVASSSCRQLKAFIDTFGPILGQATNIMAEVDADARGYVAAHPDDPNDAAILSALEDAHLGLAAANATAAGTEALTIGDANAALAPFRAAYNDLDALLAKARASNGAMAAPRAGKHHPRPIAADPIGGAS